MFFFGGRNPYMWNQAPPGMVFNDFLNSRHQLSFTVSITCFVSGKLDLNTYILSHCNAQQMHWNRSRKDMPLVFVPLFHLSSFSLEFPVFFKSWPTKVCLDFSNKKNSGSTHQSTTGTPRWQKGVCFYWAKDELSNEETHSCLGFTGVILPFAIGFITFHYRNPYSWFPEILHHLECIKPCINSCR